MGKFSRDRRWYTCTTAIFNSRCINGLREDSQFESEVGDSDGKRAMEFSNRRSIVLFLVLIIRSYIRTRRTEEFERSSIYKE